ncbi:DUF2442 domain-containing protein [uncultured Rikenella sp.]|uniref:DUF2442 domain-containing protein n=1 Tax=uncultured Rikenella sp. TaxID=368003 RepID=UPI0026064E17|nr:DUF2442 domain-containing protein [uncultured Rikenella sp.]
MKALKIWFEEGRIHLTTDEGRTASLPLKAFPRLYNATDEQRQDYTLSPFGIHWEELDEDLSFEGFFAEEGKPKNEIAQIFDNLPEINVNQLARVMGINQSLMAKYICGVATPSESRRREIEAALHRLGHELTAISIR